MVKRFLVVFVSYFALITAATLGGLYLASRHIIGVGAVAIIIVVATVIPLLFMSKTIFSTSKKDKQILANGVEALAEITDIQETGVTVNDIYYNIKLELRVKPINAPIFEVKTTHLFSRLQIPRIGDVLRVKYDPSNLMEVVILTEANVTETDQKDLEAKALEMLVEIDKYNKS